MRFLSIFLGICLFFTISLKCEKFSYGERIKVKAGQYKGLVGKAFHQDPSTKEYFVYGTFKNEFTATYIKCENLERLR